MAKAVSAGVVDTLDAVEALNTVETVDPETATKAIVPIAKFKAILQMNAENANTGGREETIKIRSAFASGACTQATSKSIASPTNI